MAAVVLSPLSRQIAALGLALCAVALSLAYPLRSYLQQQVAERQATSQQQSLERQIADLKAEQAALNDPAYIKAEAKRRLQYVSPGDTVYVVKVPRTSDANPDPAPQTVTSPGLDDPAIDPKAATDPPAPEDHTTTEPPWYRTLWDTVSGDGPATSGGH